MAKKLPELKALHDKRWDIVHQIRDLIKEKDSKKKFETLIKLCKNLHAVIDKINSMGDKAEADAQRFSIDYWKDRYNKFNEYTNRTKTPTKWTQKPLTTKVKPVQTVDSKNVYFIMLCWTAKPEYCVCDSIIDNVKTYLENMKAEQIDVETTQFPDRIEYSKIFKLKASQSVYEVILSSAKYILDMSIDSIYDNCNIGIFGKKVD